MNTTAQSRHTLSTLAHEEPQGTFPVTHWSVVLAAGNASESRASAALETLCRQYWFALYVYARRQGRSHHEAEDYTQDFLAHLLASGGIAHAHRERGRFRTFLLTAMRNHLIKEWRRAHAEKRGGFQEIVSIDALADGERRFSHEAADTCVTPEQAFDRAWARQLIDRAVTTLHGEYDARHEGVVFSILYPVVLGQSEPHTHAHYAKQLLMTEHGVAVALQRLRRRLGEKLREAVAETVPDVGDVEDELRYLISAATAEGAENSEVRAESTE